MTDERALTGTVLRPGEEPDEQIIYDQNGETTSIDGSRRWRYDLPLKDGTTLPIHLSQPTEAQMLVLLNLASSLEETPVQAVQLYLEALEVLMAPGESHKCQRALLRGRLEVDAFVGVGMAAAKHFYPALEVKDEAPKHGPTATRRPRRK